ncbi:MAG TPA: hydrogenase maturation protease [Syntrophales bacterium]|nr:hydrogenase maturation protease [Syntrophales bacterium]
MKTLILGMGNPILSDDGVGLFIAEMLEGKIPCADVAVSAMIGLSLFDLIIGYDKLFIVDAMTTTSGKIGELKKISEYDRYGTLHLFSSHGLDIFELMELGVRCGLPMPRLAAVYGIEIGDEVAFSESISPALSEKLPGIISYIITDITSALPAMSATNSPCIT